MKSMLNDIEAADFLGIEPGTIRNWRAKGTGPAFHKMPGIKGAVRYDIRDLEEFKRQCRQMPTVRTFIKEELSVRI